MDDKKMGMRTVTLSSREYTEDDGYPHFVAKQTLMVKQENKWNMGDTGITLLDRGCTLYGLRTATYEVPSIVSYYPIDEVHTKDLYMVNIELYPACRNGRMEQPIQIMKATVGLSVGLIPNDIQSRIKMSVYQFVEYLTEIGYYPYTSELKKVEDNKDE